MGFHNPQPSYFFTIIQMSCLKPIPTLVLQIFYMQFLPLLVLLKLTDLPFIPPDNFLLLFYVWHPCPLYPVLFSRMQVVLFILYVPTSLSMCQLQLTLSFHGTINQLYKSHICPRSNHQIELH
jgi:hypothetical protein